MFEIINTLFCAIPVLCLVLFIILLTVYIKRKKESAEGISEAQAEKLKKLKTYVTVTGIMAAVFISVVVILGGLFLLFMINM